VAIAEHGHPYRPRYRALKATAHVDWRRRFDLERGGLDGNVIEWDDVHHLIIIPTYKESVDKLRATLGKLAESEVALEKLLVVVAMEAADEGAPERFEILQREFGHSFLAMIGTRHPSDIPAKCAASHRTRRGPRASEAAVLRRDGLRTRPHDSHQL